MQNLVTVRPIEKKRWHNKSSKELSPQPKVYTANYSREMGGYSVVFDKGQQEKLEKALQLKPGDLSTSWNYSTNAKECFWDTFKVKLAYRTNLLDITDPKQELQLCLLKGCSLIANSTESINSESEFVITDENHETKIKLKKSELKDASYKAKFKLTKKQKIQVVRILGQKNSRGRSEDWLDAEVSVIVDDSPQRFLDLLKTTPARLASMELLRSCLDYNILTQQGVSIYYGEIKMGTTFDLAVDYINDKKNNDFKIRLNEELESRV